MTLRELMDMSIVWHPERYIKILNDPVYDLKPERMLARSAYSVLGDREVAWFSVDIIALREK